MMVEGVLKAYVIETHILQNRTKKLQMIFSCRYFTGSVDIIG